MIATDIASKSAFDKPAAKPRHWWRLYASTYVVLLMAAAVVFSLNVPGQYTVHIDPFRPATWRSPSELAERIEHGWPWTYLVRTDRRYDDQASGQSRSTRIWSFTEDRVAFRPGELAKNVAAACAVLVACIVGWEYWRRQRRRIWQLHITDVFAITALIATALWYGLKTKREFEREIVALRKMGMVVDDDGTIISGTWEAAGEEQKYQRSRGGPSWLRELLGKAFPHWWDRTVVHDIPLRDSNLADLRGLQALSVRLFHQRDALELSAIEDLPNLKVLQIDQLVVVPNIPPLPDDPPPGSVAATNARPANRWEAIGRERDRVLATILGHAKNARRLERLVVRYTALGDQSAEALGEVSQLRILDLAHCDLRDEDVRHVARLPRLQDLILDDATIADGALRHLREAKVRRISLRGCDLSVDHLTQLAQIESVRVLNLAACAMDVAEPELVARMPHLERLTLPLRIDESAVDRLKKASAGLTIDYEGNLEERWDLKFVERLHDPFARDAGQIKDTRYQYR